jgi:hypothetical protein
LTRRGSRRPAWRTTRAFGAVDLAAGDRGVGAEGHDDEVGEAALVALAAEHADALLELAAAARVDVVALLREVGEREQHHAVADRERRPRGDLLGAASASAQASRPNSATKPRFSRAIPLCMCFLPLRPMI